MESGPECVAELERQLRKGMIQVGYRYLHDFISSLRLSLESRHPELAVSRSVYHGYLDMSYFAITDESLRLRKLKVAVVFNYDAFRFEIWLSAANKAVQEKFWKAFRKGGFDAYPVVDGLDGRDSILEQHIDDAEGFADPAGFMLRLEDSTIAFITEITGFLDRVKA